MSRMTYCDFCGKEIKEDIDCINFKFAFVDLSAGSNLVNTQTRMDFCRGCFKKVAKMLKINIEENKDGG